MQENDEKGWPHFAPDEIAAVQQVLRSGKVNYLTGDKGRRFETNFAATSGCKYGVAVANGSLALELALKSIGIGPGDEVITADFTFAATVEVIGLLNLTPVLVDVEPDSFNIDIEALKKAITPKTKAIVPVHLFGQVANMEAILKIAKEHNLFVIEDNAQAMGANYTFKDGSKKKAGTIGNVGTTSFFPSKNLGCYGDGGAIFTNDDDLAHIIRGIVNHGMYKRYYHDVVGVNSRLDSIQAAVLKAKLPLLDEYCNARRNAARFYNNVFTANPNIITPTSSSCGQICATCDCHVFHQYTLQITNGKRDELHKHLLDNGIANAIYYPVPLHKQKAYEDERYNEDDFTVTNKLVQTVISLPMHTELDEEQLTFITKTINDFLS